MEQKPMCAGSPDHCPQVQQAAEDAVCKVFAILGVDVDVPKEVEEFRENLRFGGHIAGRSLRFGKCKHGALELRPGLHILHTLI